jgi:hypothetical protein
MRLFKDAIKGMCIQRDAGQIVTEPFSGEVSETFKSTDYAPTYTVHPDGTTCTCSKKSSLGVCRHQIYHRYIASANSEEKVKLFCAGMVNQTLVQIRHRNDQETDTILLPADRPDSPDLDIMLEEAHTDEDGAAKAASPDPPPNQKYNQTLDKCVLTAELVSQYSGDRYRKRMAMLDNINRYLRDGEDEFQAKIMDFLENPHGFNKTPVAANYAIEQDPPAAEYIHAAQNYLQPHDEPPAPEIYQQDYPEDVYMFPAGIFAAPSTPVHPPANPPADTPADKSPLSEPVFANLSSVTRIGNGSAMKFHAGIKNPGRPPKRFLNFGSPTTPYRKRSKLN